MLQYVWCMLDHFFEFSFLVIVHLCMIVLQVVTTRDFFFLEKERLIKNDTNFSWKLPFDNFPLAHFLSSPAR